MIRILGTLAKKRNKFDFVVIETTGLADPAPVAQSFFVDDDVRASYYLDAIVTVVDCKHLLIHLDEERPKDVENEALEQIAFADRILLNKVDLVSEKELNDIKGRVQAINSVAKIFPSEYGRINLDNILNVNGFDLSRVLAMDPEFLQSSDHQHDQSISSVGILHEGFIDGTKFQSWMRELLITKGADLFRSKGVLYFAGKKHPYVFQAVHMLMSGNIETEHVSPAKPTNRLIFIGRNLDREYLNANFKQCIE